MPWDDIVALFIGGTTEWKESSEVGHLCVEAKRRGKWVHAGRVNTKRRATRFMDVGADSMDGSSLSRFPDRWIPWFMQHVENEKCQMKLPGQ